MVTRLFEMVIAALGVVLVSPVLLLAMLAIRLESKGGAIFRQQRVGEGERVFTCYKLRTMYQGTPEAPTHLTSPSSVTRVGNVLRKYKIDELSQLFNVLSGTMAFVGPRPCLLTQQDVIAVRRRLGVFEVRPGITGLAQLSGVGMEAPERLGMLDAQYARSASVAVDVRLILATAMAVFLRRQFQRKVVTEAVQARHVPVAIGLPRITSHS